MRATFGFITHSNCFSSSVQGLTTRCCCRRSAWRPNPVVCSRLSFHRTQQAGCIHRDQQMQLQGGNSKFLSLKATSNSNHGSMESQGYRGEEPWQVGWTVTAQLLSGLSSNGTKNIQSFLQIFKKKLVHLQSLLFSAIKIDGEPVKL